MHVEGGPSLCVQSTSASPHSKGGTYYTDHPAAPPNSPRIQEACLRKADYTPAQRGSEWMLAPPLLPVTFALAMLDGVSALET